jgi:hypothetical protein
MDNENNEPFSALSRKAKIISKGRTDNHTKEGYLKELGD